MNSMITANLETYPRQKSNGDLYLSTNLPNSSRFRGMNTVDINTWDDEEAIKLQYTFRPRGNFVDCFSLFRCLFGVRKSFQLKLNSSTMTNSNKLRGIVWFVKDPCGIICMIVTCFLIIFAEIVIDLVILTSDTSSNLFYWITGIIYHILIGLAVFSYYKAVTLDPGSLPFGTATQAVGKYLQTTYPDMYIVRCTKCLCIKLPRAHHCRMCQRCIYKMDHHCPWINNCVGERNQKFFILFTLYISLSSFFAIYMIINHVYQCLNSDWEKCQNKNQTHLFGSLDLAISPFISGLFLVCLMCESFVFGLFTMIMFCTQMCNVSNDKTGIENIKKEEPTWKETGGRSNWRTSISNISWRWFSPFTEPQPITTSFGPTPDELPDNSKNWGDDEHTSNEYIDV